MATCDQLVEIDQYGCVRCSAQRHSQSWLLMNQRVKGWQSSAFEYSSLAEMLLCRRIALVERKFDEYGIYWTIANTEQPNKLQAVYLGRSEPSRWKGDLAEGVYPMGTEGTMQLQFAPESSCTEWRFSSIDQPDSFAVLSRSDQVYLESVLPP
jgi:hypothetical protein